MLEDCTNNSLCFFYHLYSRFYKYALYRLVETRAECTLQFNLLHAPCSDYDEASFPVEP
jgi:hypothetical protein